MTLPENDQEIIRYLLHEIDDDELSAMEERVVNDSAFFELVASVEDDLIMQYVRGAMDKGLKTRFEQAYLQTADRRARIESARQLRETVREVAEARSRAKPVPFFTMPGMRMAAAAAVLLVAGGVTLLLLWNNGFFGAGQPGSGTQQMTVALTPGRLRSGNATEAGAQFSLPGGVKEVVFRLSVPEGPAYGEYRFVVGTPEHPAAFRGIVVVRGGMTLAMVPAEILSTGDYTLELLGVAADGEVHPVATYYFRSAR